MARRENGDYLERVISEGAEPAAASNWFRGEILRHLNDRQEKIEDFPIPAADLAALIAAVKDDRISGGRAKNLLQESLDQSVSLGELITQAGDQVQDEDALSGWVDQVLQGNPDAVSKIQSGDMKPMGFLMGQIMRLSSGQAHPKKVQELIRLKLSD